MRPIIIVKPGISLIAICTLLTMTSGCKKLTQVDTPVTNLSADNVYASDATAIAAVTGIYSSISNTTPYSPQLPGMSGLGGLSADELTLYSGVTGTTLNLYYTNNLSNNTLQDFWLQIYPVVFLANACVEGVTSSATLTPAVKSQLLGEAKFSRALCYFYLVNLYGDVPLVLSTAYTTTSILPRSPKDQVWGQIVQDLSDAQKLLNADYLDATLLQKTDERVRPTKSAATALLARAYLYTGNWSGADSASSAVIANSSYKLDDLDQVFLKNSTEAIWQLQPVTNNGFNTPDALAFIIPATGPDNVQHYAYLSDFLLSSFEPGDQRRFHWVDSVDVGGTTYYHPYKYKSDSLNAPITEYTMVLRLGEQYLIRAEAKARQNDLMAGLQNLNAIRNRAKLSDTTASSQSELLSLILHERQTELFTEWGHRWLDLKRTSTIDQIMGADSVCANKGGQWRTERQWFPVPLSEIQADPKLVQNIGY